MKVGNSILGRLVGVVAYATFGIAVLVAVSSLGNFDRTGRYFVPATLVAGASLGLLIWLRRRYTGTKGGARSITLFGATERRAFDAVFRRARSPGLPEAPDHIRKLVELRDAGVLTAAEFDAKKAELLARDWSANPSPPSGSEAPPTVNGAWNAPGTAAAAEQKRNPGVRSLAAVLALFVLIGLGYNSLKGVPVGTRGGGGGTTSAAIGEIVTINGVELTLLEATYVKSLEFQQPPAGSIYVAYKVRVKAVSEKHFVGINNFTVAADGTQQGQFGIVVNAAWEPLLALDQVNPGNTLTGWITFTVPRPTSFVLLTYRDSLFSGGSDAQWSLTCCT